MKRLLLVTFDPELVHRGDGPGPSLEQIKAAGQKVEAALQDLGLELTNCRIDRGETAESVLSQALSQGSFDCVLIGAGIRLLPEHTVLFEKLVNVVHRQAPGAKFAFNATRDNAPEAALRVMGQP